MSSGLINQGSNGRDDSCGSLKGKWGAFAAAVAGLAFTAAAVIILGFLNFSSQERGAPIDDDTGSDEEIFYCPEGLYFPEFVQELQNGTKTEWSFFRQTSIENMLYHYSKTLAFSDPSVDSYIIDEYFSEKTTGLAVVGFHVYNAIYTLGKTVGYMYIETGYRYTTNNNTAILDDFDASTAGRYFCFWAKSNLTRLDLTIQFETSSLFGSETTKTLETTNWTNLCIDTLQLEQSQLKPGGPVNLKLLRRIVFVHSNQEPTAKEFVHLQLALLYFSTAGSELYQAMPSLLDPSTKIVKEGDICKFAFPTLLSKPQNCTNFYPEFNENLSLVSSFVVDKRVLQNVDSEIDMGEVTQDINVSTTEWSLLRVTDNLTVDIDDVNIAAIENGTGLYPGQVIKNNLQYYTDDGDELITAGNLIFVVEYRLERSQVMYLANTYKWISLFDGGIPVDIRRFGDHFCIWLKFSGVGHILTISLRSSDTAESYFNFLVKTPKWTHYCFPYSLLRTDLRKDPVNLNALREVMVKHFGSNNKGLLTGEMQTFKLQYTLLYFTSIPTILPVFPALYNPLMILTESENGESCAYLTGPDDTTNISIIFTPDTIQDYESSYEESEFNSSNRMAILLLTKNSEWLDLVDAFITFGIPVHLTESVHDAIFHDVIFVYPQATLSLVPEETARKLIEAMMGGKVVIFDGINHPSLLKACELSQAFSVRTSYSYIMFNNEVSNLTRSFTCAYGIGNNRPASSACTPNSINDPEKYIKLWLDIKGEFGTGFPVQSLNALNSSLKIASYVERQLFLDGGGPIFDGDGNLIFTENTTEFAAITETNIGSSGKCYAMALDLGNFIALSKSYTLTSIGRAYSGVYSPGYDMLLRLVKNIYTNHVEAVTLHPIPYGKQLSIMLTHNCDNRESEIALAYSNQESMKNVKSTFYIYTKYIKDYYGEPFFYESWEPFIEVVKDGHELGSHSVSHSPNFGKNQFQEERFIDYDFGTGEEKYRYGRDNNYSPFVSCEDYRTSGICTEEIFESWKALICDYFIVLVGKPGVFQCGIYRTANATLTGDLRVSKYLVDRIYRMAGFSDLQCVSYRPGHLLIHDAIAEALVMTGYGSISSYTTPQANTQLFFRQSYDFRNAKVGEKSKVNVWEFPILFDDTVYGVMRPSWRTEQLGPNIIMNDTGTDFANYSWDVASHIAKFGGIVVISITPSEPESSFDNQEYKARDKIEWALELIERTKDYSMTSTIKDMQGFVQARNGAEVDWTTSPNKTKIRISLAENISGLTLEIPSSWNCNEQNPLIISTIDNYLDEKRKLIVLTNLRLGVHVIEC